MALPQIPIILIDSTAVDKAVAVALAGLPFAGVNDQIASTAILARSADSRLGYAATSYLEGQGLTVRLRPPPSWRDLVGRERWRRVPIGNPAARYPIVSVPADLVPPRPVIAVADLDAGDALPIDSFLRYVHPRLAIAARMIRPEQGVGADVAIAFHAVAVLVAGVVDGRRIIAATTDLVAGHLLALAFRTLAEPDDEERIGPWEDPTVQRATELGAGVVHPGQLSLRCRPEGAGQMALLTQRVHLILGMA